jgi:hypothetical protein
MIDILSKKVVGTVSEKIEEHYKTIRKTYKKEKSEKGLTEAQVL